MIYAADSMLMEHGAACLAAMSLRQPANAAKIAQVGGVDIMVKAMKARESWWYATTMLYVSVTLLDAVKNCVKCC